MNPDRKRPITLEDLLHLKRAERPPAEFWTRFDRDLRAKQLAALVEQRPWWRTALPRVFAGFGRYSLPLGATAVLALTFFTVRDYSPVAPRPSRDEAKPVQAAVRAASAPASVVATSASAPLREIDAQPLAANEEDFSAAADPAVPAVATVDSARVVPAVALLEESPNRTPTPSARSIAANFEAAQASDPELARRFLGATRGFEARVLPARAAAVEPLAQMTTPSEARRARFVASAAMPAAFSPVGSSDKVARRLSDEQLYDRISRVNARGAGVLVKF